MTFLADYIPMTSTAMASPVNASNNFIEEISLTIVAKDLTPTMISQDFLKFSGIVPREWELAQQPVSNPNYSQLSFTSGVSINAQPRTVTINEPLTGKELEDLIIPKIAQKYLEKLPHAEYVGLSFSPKILVPFPTAPQLARQFITNNLLASGSWKKIGQVPVQAGINLMYYLERCQLTISISEAKLQNSQQSKIGAILFSGNFNYNVNLGQNNLTDRTTQMTAFWSNWQQDLTEFRDIVSQKFLEKSSNTASSIGETSLFPGQTL